MRARSAIGAKSRCDAVVWLLVYDRSVSVVVWDFDPEVWRELVAWLAGYDGVVDEVGKGGGARFCAGDWVALFDAVDIEEDFRLRRSVCVVCLLYVFYLFMRTSFIVPGLFVRGFSGE